MTTPLSGRRSCWSAGSPDRPEDQDDHHEGLDHPELRLQRSSNPSFWPCSAPPIPSATKASSDKRDDPGAMRRLKWTPFPGPLDRGGYLLRSFPISTGGIATIPDQMGHRLPESFTEAMSARSPSLSEAALGTFLNGPRPPCPKPKMKAADLSSARWGRRTERHQRSVSVFFENGSDGNARSIMSAWKSIRASARSRLGEDRHGQIGHSRLGLPLGRPIGLAPLLVQSDLRKTCVTYYDEHVPESSVEILGHSVGGINYRHYAHRAPLAFKAVRTLPQPTAFSALLRTGQIRYTTVCCITTGGTTADRLTLSQCRKRVATGVNLRYWFPPFEDTPHGDRATTAIQQRNCDTQQVAPADAHASCICISEHHRIAVGVGLSSESPSFPVARVGPTHRRIPKICQTSAVYSRVAHGTRISG